MSESAPWAGRHRGRFHVLRWDERHGPVAACNRHAWINPELPPRTVPAESRCTAPGCLDAWPDEVPEPR